MQSLNEQSHVLVVGASGGLGEAFVNRLLMDSPVATVWAAARNPDVTAIQRLMAQHGSRVQPIDVELTDEHSISAMAERIGRDTPRLHLLINAFGLLHDESRGIWPEKKLEDVTVEGLEANFRINAMAPALIARACLPLLNHRERAVFASLSARVGSISDNRLGGWYSYRSSKAAQNMFTRGLAIECSRRARRVICLALHPGTTDSALSEPFQKRVPDGKLFTPDFAASRLLTRIDEATLEDSGRFLAWDGEPISW